MICDNDSIHHARAVTRYLDKNPRLELLYGARYSRHDNPVERVWAGLKNYVANTAVTWPGRTRQIHALLPQPPTRPDARRRRPLDQPLAASGLRADLLECCFSACSTAGASIPGRVACVTRCGTLADAERGKLADLQVCES